MHRLQDAVARKIGRLLRVLFFRLGEMSADSATARMLRMTGYPISAVSAIIHAHSRSMLASPQRIDLESLRIEVPIVM